MRTVSPRVFFVFFFKKKLQWGLLLLLQRKNTLGVARGLEER